jgi:hypothetical protein
MADEKRQLILDLLARNKMGSETGSAARDLDKVGSAAEAAAKDTEKLSEASKQTSKAVDKLGDQAEATAKETDKLGDQAKDTARAVDDMGDEANQARGKIGRLDHEIGKLNQSLVLMAGEMAAAGTAAERVDFSKGIRKTQAEIRNLEKGKNILERLLPQPEAIAQQAMKSGEGAGEGLLDGLKSKLGASGGAGALVPILAGAALAAAPIMGATIAAGIIGGSGGAGILGGVMLASKSPEVKQAGSDLAASVFAEAYMMARRNFVGPTIESIGLIRKGWGQMSGDVNRLFQATSKQLPALTSGVMSAVGSIVRGIADASEAFPSVVDALSAGISGIGDAIGDMFTDLKDNGVDAGVALLSVLRIVENTIRVVGTLVNGLAESFGFLAKLGAFGKDTQQEYVRMTANAKIAAEANNDVATSLGTVRSAGASAAAGLKALADSVGDLTEANRSLYGSQIGVAEAFAETKKRLEENGAGVSLNTEKGRENRKSLLSLAEAMIRERDAIIKLNGDGEKANSVMDRNRARFIDLADKMGYSKTAARKLAAQLLGIPNVSPTVNVKGIPRAKTDIEKLKDRLAGIKDRTVYVHVAMVEGRKLSVDKRLDRIGARASGGPVVKGNQYVVGEHGPEILEVDSPGRMLSAAASRGMAPTAAMRAVARATASTAAPRSSGGGWAGPLTARLEVVGPEELRVFLRKIIRTMDIIPGYQAGQSSWTGASS